jgi:protoporphyrinogen oxidase
VKQRHQAADNAPHDDSGPRDGGDRTGRERSDERPSSAPAAAREPRVLVAGGGPAGLTAAYDLARRGIPSTVFEKAELVGGHARTNTFRGYRFDIGGHRFFTKIPEAQQIWEEVLGDRFMKVQRLSRIYYGKKFFYYPLRIGNVLRGLGLWNSLLIVLSFARSAMFPIREEKNLEQWVINRFGRRLYRTFFKTYTEKVWGIPCTEISAEWAAQRIKGLSMKTAIINALVPDRRKSVKSLINEFQYPELGPGMMWEFMQQRIDEMCGEVLLEHEVVKIHHEAHHATGFTVRAPDGERFVPGSEVVLSMPIAHVARRLDPPAPPAVLEAAAALRYRDFLTVCVIADGADLFPDNWIYIHDSDVRMGRLQNFKNWSRHMVPDPGKTSLGAEYFVDRGDDLWEMSDEALVALTARELEILQLVAADRVEMGVVYRQPYAYPVYDDSYKVYLEVLERFFKKFDNLQLVGRNGLHKYNNMDHSMLTALLVVRNICGENHDVWSVNADEVYHEEAVEKA